jgi:hypothetical protein
MFSNFTIRFHKHGTPKGVPLVTAIKIKFLLESLKPRVNERLGFDTASKACVS